MDTSHGGLLTHADEITLAAAIEAGVLAADRRSRASSTATVTEGELLALEMAGVAAWRRFVGANVRLVWLVVLPVARRTGLDVDELFQEGTLGLLEALQRYDHRRGARFATFALPWIRMRVTDASATRLGTLGLPAGRARAWRRIRAIESRLEIALGRRPRADEVANASGDADVTVRGLLAYEPAQALAPDFDRAVVELSQPITRVEIVRLFRGLPQPQKVVILRRFGLGGFPAMTQAQIADELGLSESTVRRRERAALAQMRQGATVMAA